MVIDQNDHSMLTLCVQNSVQRHPRTKTTVWSSSRYAKRHTSFVQNRMVFFFGFFPPHSWEARLFTSSALLRVTSETTPFGCESLRFSSSLLSAASSANCPVYTCRWPHVRILLCVDIFGFSSLLQNHSFFEEKRIELWIVLFGFFTEQSKNVRTMHGEWWTVNWFWDGDFFCVCCCKRTLSCRESW